MGTSSILPHTPDLRYLAQIIQLAVAPVFLLAGLGAFLNVCASRLARILIEAEPYRVDYLTTGLEAYRAAGNHRSLERVYQSARARLAELGETLPRRWQMFLTNQ